MKKAKEIISAMVSLFLFSCGNNTGNSPSELAGIKIGTQTWATKNLDVDRFRNGEIIPQAKAQAEWDAADEQGKSAWCYYDNNPENGNKYGKLYNWYAVVDPRGLAPAGWHIPNDSEWIKLFRYVQSIDVKKSVVKLMKSTSGWGYFNGTNESGFTGLPGGRRRVIDGFCEIMNIGYWWSSTAYGSKDAWTHLLYFDNSKYTSVNREKGNGISIRCIKD